MRPIRAAALTTLGAFAGFVGAAAIAKHALSSRGDESSDELALVAIFDGIDLKSRAAAFTGGSMLAWYGGVNVDLSEATLAPGAHLSVHAIFGGIAIRVPPGWRVESGMHAVAGGVDVHGAAAESADAPTLTLDGFALFGGIAVGARAPLDDSAETTDT